ncbi:dynamin family protein [Microseira wollei]|uniref:G domain-containing protein n=1 Tax=Microseira wollei NIES-4236 TaxID=2530354 RepID=A0AAV3XBX0_9CYAN|nr:dynamin family protein [Microseira wollei]GET37904.1 hypothetical protein MiSe_26580 [Microseira wollei NIES-4236]
MTQPMQTEYKTFTASIETPTLLDDFAPTYIEDMAQRFEPIKQLKEEYCNQVKYYGSSLNTYKGFETASDALYGSVTHMNQVFADFQNRMKYFTIVFFGAVSAGKTSMICDLAHMNPKELTRIISSQPGFDSQKDSISIGPNVATINLYEILIEKSCTRLVDVPGIGGVVHKDDSLAPFVDMADCIIFLLDANSDITKNDRDFLFEHVAAIEQVTAKTRGASGFTAEKGLDKKILVVLNKWKSLTGGGRPLANVEKDLERKKDWILYGSEDKSFSGIAEFFAKAPAVVRANTSGRDEDTGERFPGWEEFLDMIEVVNALRQILCDEGAALRLNRPRIILTKEINRVCEKLAEEKTKRSLDNLVDELNRLGIRISSMSDAMQAQFDSRLNNLANIISSSLSPQIKRALNDWKPKVGLFNQLKMAVPEWFPGAKNANLGKTAIQELIKEAWQTEIRDLIKQRVDFSKIESIIKQEAETLSTLISSTFRVELSNASPQLIQKVSEQKTIVKTGSIGGDDTIVSLKKAIEQAVKKIENDVVKDLLAVLTFDAILIALAGAVLNPVGSFVVAMVRRWMRGDKKEREIRQEIEIAVDEVVNEAARSIRDRVAAKVREGIEETGKKIREILAQEQETLSQPMEVIDRAIADLKSFQSKLDSLSLR